LLALKGSPKEQAIKQALADPEREVRVAGLDLLKDLEVQEKLKIELLSEVIEKRTMEEKQAAVEALASLSLENSRPVLESLVGQLEEGSLPAEIQLELSEALETAGASE